MLASTGVDNVSPLPPFTPGIAFTHWEIDPFLTVVTVAVAGLYLAGVWKMRSRGDRWPIGRTVSFVLLGMGGFYFATSSGVGVYDDTLLSAHMIQHMVLSMMVPLCLALGAPVTLALRTLPKRPRGWLLAVLHSRPVQVLTFAPLTFTLFVVSPWALYFTSWYDASLHSAFIHEMMHVHLVLVGSLFFWPLVGIDPVPGRVAYPFRMILVFLTLPFHAWLGVTIMDQTRLIGGEWYTALAHSPGYGWVAPAQDQQLAGGLLWGAGDIVGLTFFAVLFVQWVRDSMREAAREDRRLDLLEARAAAAARDAAVAARETSLAHDAAAARRTGLDTAGG